MAGDGPALPLCVSLGPSEVKTLSVSSHAPQRFCVPQTLEEKRVARVCSRLPEARPVHEVKWLASHLRRIPTLQHIPAWKLESLGRNMTAAFAREGDDARLLCADPAYCYFLVSGSLLPIEMTGKHAAPSPIALRPLLHGSTGCTSHRVPTAEVAAVTESKVGEMSTSTDSPKGGGKPESFLRPVACASEKTAGLAFLSWAYPCDNNRTSGSALTPVQGNGSEKVDDGSDVGSAVSKSLFSVPATTPSKTTASPPAPDADPAPSTQNGSVVERVEYCPILPGQSLDVYLLHNSVGAAGKTGPEANHDEAGRSEVDSALPEGSTGDSTATRGWRLEAQERVCVGRVSRRFFQELEREEPKHDVEMKIAFLRKTELFGDGFSVPVLRRLAVLMERQEQPVATVVRCKGAAVHEVVMVESGEAVRLGDRQADSAKNHSSLRVRTGQMYGAEEALSGTPVYTGNLMTMTPLRFFTIPAAAFVRATDEVWTPPLYRLRSRARVMNHACRAPSGGQQRPSTATGVGNERSTSRNWSSGGSGEKSLPALTRSKTQPTPLALAPVPLFSGVQGESGLEERMNTLAAFWAPWAWSGDSDSPPNPQQQQQQRRDQTEQDCGGGDQFEPSSPFSRPQSAPAPTTARRPSAPTPPHRQVPQPEGGGDNDAGGHTLRLSQETVVTRSRSAGDLPRRRAGGMAGAPGGACNNLFAPARRGGNGERRGCREQASPASPDFRRLRRHDHGSMPLAGCDFNALPAEFLEGSRPSTAGGNGGGGSKFRPESLMGGRRSSSGGKGKPGTRHERQAATTAKKRAATLRPTTAPAAESGRNTSLVDKAGVGWLNAPLGERPPLVVGGRIGDDGGVHIGTAGGVGGFDPNDGDNASALTWNKGIHQAPPSLSTQSTSSSLGSASTSLAATLELWTKREIVAAKRAVSCRPQRTRVCLALRANASASAGMAAAQRSLRGAFVMSKMGDAKARSTWRP